MILLLQIVIKQIDYMAIINMETKTLAVPLSVGRQLNFTAGAASAVATRLLEPHGLSLAQWAVLSVLWRNGDVNVKDLARLTGNAPPATSRIVDRMIEAGLLRRTQDMRDRRAVAIALTDRGEEMRPLMTIFESVNEVMLSGLTKMEERSLFDLLARVEANGRTWLEPR